MAADPNLDAGIAAVQAGDLVRAQQLLALVVRATPTSVDGWWWLAQAMTLPERRKFCLERVLALNPRHAGALQMLMPSAPAPTLVITPKPNPPVDDALPAPPRAHLVITPNPPAPPPVTAPPVAPLAAAGPPSAEATEAAQQPALTAISNQKSTRLSVAQLVTLGGLGLGLCLLLGALAFAAAPNLRAVFAPLPTVNPALQGPSATAIIFPTLPPEWTATPTRDPQAATATPRPSATPRATPTPALRNLADQIASVQANLDAALEHMLNREYAEALVDWNAVLAVAPDYAYAHDQRGEAYSYWADERATYAENVSAALADYDAALALDPNVGEYFLHRYYIFDWLAENAYENIDRDFYNRLALDSARQANVLGNSDELSARYPGLALAALGECAAAQAEFQALLAAGPDETGGLNRGLALSDACARNYAAALTHITAALAVTNDEDWQLERAAILYQLGRYTEAKSAVDALIAANPQSCDCRLYLRAVIRYALGDATGAQADLDQAQTTGRASEGLREYLLARLAQAAGDQPGAISYYQDSESTLKIIYTQLRLEIVDRLTALGAAPLDLSGIVLPTATPIVVNPVPQPPPLGPQLLNRPDGYIGEVLSQSGTGPFTLAAGQSRDFQFQSVLPLPGERLGFNLYLIGPTGVVDGADSGLRLNGWQQVGDAWVKLGLNWGAQKITGGESYITTTYDIFTTLSNPTNSPIEVLNLQIYINDAGAP